MRTTMIVIAFSLKEWLNCGQDKEGGFEINKEKELVELTTQSEC